METSHSLKAASREPLPQEVRKDSVCVFRFPRKTSSPRQLAPVVSFRVCVALLCLASKVETVKCIHSSSSIPVSYSLHMASGALSSLICKME